MRRFAIILLALLLGATALAEGTDMKYDFSGFTHVTLMGIDISTLNEDELSPLYQVARYCHDIGFAPFSPIASGLLSGRITPQAKFESYDDVRNWVP
jgi:aryl-alcohol dehydrogenase-like predicted oxidoreductase